MFFTVLLNFYNDSTNLKSANFVLIGAIISLFIFLTLPLLENYYFFNPGDSLTHLGYVNDIINTGSFVHDTYPIIHILIYNISIITGINPRIIMMLIPQVFTIFFILSVYLLSKSLNYEKKESLLIAALATIPVFAGESLYTVPSAEAFFMVPFTLFLFVRSRTSQENAVKYSIMLVLTLIMYPFFHQEVSLLLVMIMGVIYVVVSKTSSLKHLSFLKNRNNLTPIILLFVGFAIWYSSSVIFGNTMQIIYNSIFFDLGTSPANIVSETSLKGIALAYNIIKIYGVEISYLLISCLAAIILLIRIIKKKANVLEKILFILFVLLVVINFLSFFRGLIIGLRTVKYLILISLFMIPISFHYLKRITEKKNISSIKRSLIVSIPFLLIITLSIFNTYPSPILKSFNYQITQESFDGMEFVVNSENYTYMLSEPTSPDRFKDAISGKSKNRGLVVTIPVDHFGYSNNLNDTSNNYGTTGLRNINITRKLVGNLGNFYREDRLLIIDQVTLKFNSNGRYVKDDFNMLKNDFTVNNIYENNGFNLYYVKGLYSG
jgi:hypothetical protein